MRPNNSREQRPRSHLERAREPARIARCAHESYNSPEIYRVAHMRTMINGLHIILVSFYYMRDLMLFATMRTHVCVLVCLHGNRSDIVRIRLVHDYRYWMGRERD